MALNDILQKITDEAQQKAALMKQTSNDEVKKIQEEAKAKADARRTEIGKKAEVHSVSVVKKAKTLASMEGRSDMLKEKRLLIDQAYETVLGELNDLDDAAYTDLMTKMITHVSVHAPTGGLVVPSARVELTKKAIHAAKADYDVKKESHDIKGGFIVVDGNVEINLTFKNIINNLVRPKNELEVASLLFS